MKKIKYIFLSIGIASFIACGGGESHDHDHGDGDAAMEESHEGHEHAAMEEEASTNEMVPAPEGARVFFANLEDGQTVNSPVHIEFGVEGIKIHPAGELMDGTGHHHIIVDGDAIPMGTVVPADEQHIHFGGGQTETDLELAAGEHTLTLQLADGLHRSYGEELSASITVNVAPAE